MGETEVGNSAEANPHPLEIHSSSLNCSPQQTYTRVVGKEPDGLMEVPHPHILPQIQVSG